MKKYCRLLMLVLAAGLLVGSALTAYGYYYLLFPGPSAQSATILLKRGEGFRAIADDLAVAGIIRQPLLFKAIAAATGEGRRFKAGEYAFPAAASPQAIMAMIAQGQVVVHKLTIPEGWTSQDVARALLAEPLLEGDLPPLPEGSLLPDTYHFTYGDQRRDVALRMQTAMTRLLADAWPKRQPGLPLSTSGQALILASIVEKETGLDGERAQVAGVFINRLKRGMKLQSDPTVAYGRPHAGALTRYDLQTPGSYNTYLIDGLPPTPIANPGRAALDAVLHPAPTEALYFVATGTGGHAFSNTLEEHNQRVREYRERLKNQR